MEEVGAEFERPSFSGDVVIGPLVTMVGVACGDRVVSLRHAVFKASFRRTCGGKPQSGS
jgi:hypothetical protein